MARDNPISRRTALKVTGAAAATALVAGCNDDDNGDDDDDGVEEYEAEPGEEIVFYGDQAYWEGKEPSEIEGAENPTLILEEGEEYTIGWDEGDGVDHNIEIRNEDDEVVDDLQTDIVTEPDEDQFLTFDASEEMAYYICEPHATNMRGEIDVVEGDNGDEENGEEENDE
ncbi:plastocyanin/azurin family copper-binding protein [Natronolimnohabitans sp. A-GB9]|uniref:plastocyanin/azurin family copper-binding protein n=1 Tax=Natronolimnohabitans sp. A-GB9 TaxID=3069757 RepID=UPI0027AFA226|nr:plastocyanin/azurin family copper-binding protein [Natronolimnohabitans sp. A-GB9]MDQ2050198.1 plastocyanin/azurin family copper-binding protein [Natronolimnohabitans sp. A-GB9]